MEEVLVGMSGGVDSFVTALLLKQRGFRVIGLNLEFWKESCIADLNDVCSRLGIELVCRDARKFFADAVIKPFVEGYSSGKTPNPCAVCNRYVKWWVLSEVAREMGIGKIATGHYVRIIRKGDLWFVHKGVDSVKDQSYFLWGLRQDILANALTPLGEYTKAEVKALAEANGYAALARRKESMGICFLEGEDYRRFITGQGKKYFYGEDLLRRMEIPGDILDKEGNTIGRHSGILNYTVGQKRGLPLKNEEQLYVKEIDTDNNTITGDFKSNLWRTDLILEDINIISPDDLPASDVVVKIRGLGLNPEGFIKITGIKDDSLSLKLSDPAWAVASGQPAALYRGDRLIGGGIIR